ncbi:MAG: hypothetical protein ORN98_10180 [Alphaproteobacteria bacterium]|nr:hypothetical protein [Alphaproteobacteria bacterium]
MMVATIREATQLLLDRFGGKKFQTIFIKPPWDYRESPVLSRQVGPLRTRPLGLSLPHLRSLPLYPLGQPSSWLFLYAPTGFLPEAVALMREWGFPYEAAIVWQDHWDEAPQNNRENDASETLEAAAPEHMTTKVTEQVAASDDPDDSDDSEATEDRDESTPASTRPSWEQNLNSKISGQNLTPKTAPQAFLLIGRRARRLGIVESPSKVFDKSTLRINRLRYRGAPNLPSVQDLIEYCCPPSYLELFARSNRKGWSYWGFEAELIYPGWLDEGGDLAQDVLFELPDFFAKPAEADHILGVTHPEDDGNEESGNEESGDENDPSDMSEPGEHNRASPQSDEIEMAVSALSYADSENIGGTDSAETDDELGLSEPAAPLADLETEASLALQRENQLNAHEDPARESVSEMVAPDLSLEDAYETAYEQVSTDTSDTVRPPIGETIPYDDIVPLDQILNQEEEEGAEEAEETETPSKP